MIVISRKSDKAVFLLLKFVLLIKQEGIQYTSVPSDGMQNFYLNIPVTFITRHNKHGTHHYKKYQ